MRAQNTKRSSNETQPSQGEMGLSELMDMFKEELESLSYRNYREGFQHLVKSIEKRASENPYGMALSGFELGATLVNLKLDQVRNGLVHFAKSLVLQTLEKEKQ